MTLGLFTIGLGIIPGFVWLLFFLREDDHPEPGSELFYVFLAGSAVTIVVLFLQKLWNSVASDTMGIVPFSTESQSNLAISLIALAAIEEVFKFAAAFLIVSRSKYFDEPIDAMIYMIVAALGFATVENIGALAGQLKESAFIGSMVSTATLRFVGATLLHTLSSAIVGFYWAKGLVAKRSLHWLGAGLLVATLLHAAFNFVIVSFDAGLAMPITLLSLAAFFVFSDFEKVKHPQELLEEELGTA